MASNDVASSDVASSDVASSDVAPGDAASSDVAPGDVASSDVAPGDVAPGDASSDYATVFERVYFILIQLLGAWQRTVNSRENGPCALLRPCNIRQSNT